MNRPRPMLSLEVSDRMEDSLDGLAGTFREEGMSVAFDALRLDGESINMDVYEEDIVKEKRIGQGACSSVYKARHKRTGDLYALKMFSVYDKGRRDQLRKEIRMLASIQCDALIQFHGAFYKEGTVGIILEYMDRGSLEFIVEQGYDIDDYSLAAISYQIMWGLAYLHYDNNLHRDIKPGNVLMNSRGQVKLSDFGICKVLDDSQAMSDTSVGTFRYMSIERLLGREYSSSSDLWSVGVMLIELWNKRYPFEEYCSSPIELLQRLEDAKHEGKSSLISRQCTQDMATFIDAILSPEITGKKLTSVFLEAGWFVNYGLTSVEGAHQGVVDFLAKVDFAADRLPTKKKSTGSCPFDSDRNQFSDSDGEDYKQDDFEEFDSDVADEKNDYEGDRGFRK
jgi:serine/threonine protein kinase